MTATSYSEKPEYADTGSIINDDKAIHRSGGPTENEQFGEVKRGLKSRHVQMIAIGGTIGTSVFLSAGASVASAGPLGGLISYLIVGNGSESSPSFFYRENSIAWNVGEDRDLETGKL